MAPHSERVSNGGETRHPQSPAGKPLSTGPASSTVITLIFVPVVYSLFERKTKANGRPEGVLPEAVNYENAE